MNALKDFDIDKVDLCLAGELRVALKLAAIAAVSGIRVQL